MATVRTDKPGNSLESAEIGDRIQHALDDAQSRLSDAGQRLSRATTKARDFAGEKVDTLGDIMQKHPLATIAIGLGVGYVIGRLMARD